MAKYRFQLMRGRHQDGSVKRSPTGEVLQDTRRTYSVGDVIETDKKLDELFGREKFRRLGEGENPTASSSAAEADTFDTMTVAELKQFASTEEIDLGNAKTKAEIIDVIRAAQV